MNIEVDDREIVPLNEFELGWRFEKTHSPDISESEKKQILPVSEMESKRLNKVIDYFEQEYNLREKFTQTDWISANAESDEKIERFRNQLELTLEKWDEKIIITWHRNITLKTTKEIFIKYWTDFLYPSSDDVTLISEKTNWVMFYRHFEVVNIWVRIPEKIKGE
ncbi:DUF2947 family protein [Winogradskyella psychrotolerans]|uniref:DUF2947 family protein n=1 Tax=Winogradskyella psychrotolerans TaxID=1344585 RepID=UPI001C07D9FE|nr:DUF2947 family protein [Winogradskyella psychrotolerans]MBU2930263.1 DUF2947 family protein [Winogradskyella psychrotolerans]